MTTPRTTRDDIFACAARTTLRSQASTEPKPLFYEDPCPGTTFIVGESWYFQVVLSLSWKRSRIGAAVVLVALVPLAVTEGCVGDEPSTIVGDVDSGSDVTTTANDAAPDVVVVEDSGADANVAPACDLTKPFGMPAPITELNTANSQSSATLSHDETTIYFSRGTAGAGFDGGIGREDLMTASRLKIGDTWGPPSLLTIDTPVEEVGGSVTDDNKTLFFSSDRDASLGGRDLFFATRATTIGPFVDVTDVTTINSTSDDGPAYVMPDGLTLYFGSSRVAANDLFRATRPPSGSFALDTSGVFAAINTAAFEGNPVVSVDELSLYFSTVRGTAADIWHASRSTKSDPFGSPAVVPELNTDNNGEYVSWISDDGCRIYFHRGTAGLYALYQAVKPK